MNLKYLFGGLVVILIISVPVFGHLSELPIQIWDESRLAASAYEMSRTHNWLIPTFNWEPDMWSTKPPLLLWLQVASLHLTGVNELAIRLPSALSAVATCLFMYWFLIKRFKNRMLAISAPAFLILFEGYISLHGARTGDYDCLLAMFTTMMLVYFYLYLKEKKPVYLILTALAVTFACLTKGVAPLIFLPAMGLMAILHGRLKSMFIAKEFYISLAIFVLFVPGYYLLREQYNPGYIRIVRGNELGGRFLTVIENHQEAWIFYFKTLFDKGAVWLLLSVCGMNMAVISKDKEIRDFAAYMSISVLTFLIILSFAATKLAWYLMPAYPILALLAAVGFNGIASVMLKNLQNQGEQNLKYIILALSATAFFALAYYNTLTRILHPPFDMQNPENALVAYMSQAVTGKREVDHTVILNSEWRQDLVWYEHIERQISFKDITDLKKADKVLTYKSESAAMIEARYKCQLVERYYTMSVYAIEGLEESKID